MKKILSILFLLISITSFSMPDSLYKAQIIGQAGRNQKVARGLQVGIWGRSDTLQVNGKFQITTGAANGKVLMSNSAGVGTWQSISSGGWNLNGNDSTDPSVNYFGCNDTSVMFIKMYSTDNGLTKSGSIDLTHANTSFGFGSLSSVTPFEGAMNYGEENTAFGTGALFSCDSCNGNTSIGTFSMLSLTKGRRNVGLGGATLYNLTTGNSNVAVGANSLVDLIDGSYNTAIGDSCLTFLQHGNWNTALGDSSLYTLTYGNYNIAIGHDASTTTDSASNAIALGAHVRAASNQFALSDSTTNLKWRLNGQTSGHGLVTNGTTANWQPVSIISSGTSAPVTTPNKVGDIFIDTSAKKLYFATGTSSSADWTIAN